MRIRGCGRWVGIRCDYGVCALAVGVADAKRMLFGVRVGGLGFVGTRVLVGVCVAVLVGEAVGVMLGMLVAVGLAVAVAVGSGAAIPSIKNHSVALLEVS